MACCSYFQRILMKTSSSLHILSCCTWWKIWILFGEFCILRIWSPAFKVWRFPIRVDNNFTRSCELSVISLLFIAAHIKPHFFLPISASGIVQQWKRQEISRTWTFLTGDNYSLIEFNICKTLVSTKLLHIPS